MTPATKALERAGVSFSTHQFDHDPANRDFGAEAAAAVRADVPELADEQVFKTLLVTADTGVLAVAVVPVTCQLSLKLAAAALGFKRVDMCQPAVAERSTGYVVGGISPFGQRRVLPTAIDETCELWDRVYVSGGRRGLDLGVAPADLVSVLGAVIAPLTA